MPSPRGARLPPAAPPPRPLRPRAPQAHLIRAQLLHRLPLNGERREGAFLCPAEGQLRGSALLSPLPLEAPHKGISGAAAPRLARRQLAPPQPPPPTRYPQRDRASTAADPRHGQGRAAARLRQPARAPRPRSAPAPRPLPAQSLFIKTRGRPRPSWGGIT